MYVYMYVRNLRYGLRHDSRLGQDSLYNIHTLTYEIGGFARKITTLPDYYRTCEESCSSMSPGRSCPTPPLFSWGIFINHLSYIGQ